MQFVPEKAITPFGPAVVPLTRPLPAVIEVDTPPAVAAACPLRDVTTVQSERRFPLEELVLVEALELDPVELPTLTELVEPPALVELLELTCASAGIALIPASTIEVRRILINASR